MATRCALRTLRRLPSVCTGARATPVITTRPCSCKLTRNRPYRPTDDSNQPPGRGVLSMHGLTYGVIRVDSEEKLSVLTVQDVGLVMPGGECRLALTEAP